uniref:SET domain-containing protein n=1 Tax=Callorhinchus milii TaxID=7868 RepID=A0A4W3IDR0_CALMI
MFMVCGDCESYFIEECPVHSFPTFTHDKSVTMNQPDRARLPARGLEYSTSHIANAGLGVWNGEKIIPKGIHFGPGYSWAVSDCSLLLFPSFRYVNCARKEEEQTLVAFQHWGKIYYRTCRPVPPQCELLVWYGDQFAEESVSNTHR